MKRILIVDDSSTARMFIRRCIEISARQETKFIEACNGLEALEEIKSLNPDVVFSDYTMPKMNGMELLEKIKASQKHKGILVFIISSAGNPALESKLLKNGAHAVLKKPISPTSLMPFVDNIFGENKNAD